MQKEIISAETGNKSKKTSASLIRVWKPEEEQEHIFKTKLKLNIHEDVDLLRMR